MKQNRMRLLPYGIILGIDFYLLPLLMKNTGAAMLLMLCVMPLVALVCGIVYGSRNGFGLVLPVIAVLLFVPTVFIYYNSSAWVYTVFYGGLVLAGILIGKLFYRKR